MFTTVISTEATQNLDFNYSKSTSLSASAKLSVNETIPSGTSENFVNFNFNTGSGVLLAIATDNLLYPLTIKTNNTANPSNIFNVSNTSQVISYNFLQDVDSSGNSIRNITGLFVTNTGTSEINLRIDALFDITPNL
jgi:hypothetical protein